VARGWADGTTNPAATVEAQLDKLVSDLAGVAAGVADGLQKIGAAHNRRGSRNVLATGTARSQLIALLAALNGHVTQAAGRALRRRPSPMRVVRGWKDGTANPAATVEDQLDKLVGDLIADAGGVPASAVHGAHGPGSVVDPTPPGVSVFAAIDKIITDLAAGIAADDGARRIGAQAFGQPACRLRALAARCARRHLGPHQRREPLLRRPDLKRRPRRHEHGAPYHLRAGCAQAALGDRRHREL